MKSDKRSVIKNIEQTLLKGEVLIYYFRKDRKLMLSQRKIKILKLLK